MIGCLKNWIRFIQCKVYIRLGGGGRGEEGGGGRRRRREKADHYAHINVHFSQLITLFSVQVRCRILVLEEWRLLTFLSQDID